jgi:CubicO group peptidase (beta-lactamase class C family)
MEFDSNLAEQAHRGQFAGSVLLTFGGSTLLDKGYGIADRTTGAPIGRDTAFQIASVSKQFAAAAILLLEERGKLSLSDPVGRWIAGSPAAWGPVTIHHLLTHTSGLPHWRDLPELDLFAPATWDRVLSIFSSHSLMFPPGKGWAYSSPAYHLLARAVEEASGEEYADFLRCEIFEPLGMTDTGAGNDPPRASKRALGYAAGTPVVPFELETANRGAGDLWSTTGDLARWDRAVSTPGRLLSQESLETMFTRHELLPASEASRFPVVRDLSYGYGWYLGDLRGRQVRFHLGDNPGYRSINVHFPEVDALLCVLSNEESSGVAEIALRLLDGLVLTP